MNLWTRLTDRITLLRRIRALEERNDMLYRELSEAEDCLVREDLLDGEERMT